MLVIDDFYKKMIFFFPDIISDIDQRIKEDFERLDTIIIEEIVMPEVLELLNKDIDKEKIKMVFTFFEDVCINSDDYLKNVFSITVLEILGNDKDILEKAQKYMGPVTKKLQREADIALGRSVN